MTIIEEVGPATRMVTIRGSNSVYFAVEHLDVDFLGKPEWVTVWSHIVPFRQDKAHRPGGYAFLEAAQHQKDEAVDQSLHSKTTPEVGGEA